MFLTYSILHVDSFFQNFNILWYNRYCHSVQQGLESSTPNIWSHWRNTFGRRSPSISSNTQEKKENREKTRLVVLKVNVLPLL